MPLFGPPNIEKMKKKKDIKGLLKALDYQKSAEIRAEAVKALGSIGGSEMISYIVNTLSDQEWEVRAAAVQALGSIGGNEVIPYLVNVLKNEEFADVRVEAVKVLGSIDTGEVVPHLIEALNDESKAVNRAAVKAFYSIKDERAVEPLINLLNEAGSITSEYAVTALKYQNDKRIVNPVISILIKKSSEINDYYRKSLIDVLESFRKQAIPSLKKLLLDKNAETRKCALEVLQKMKWQGDKTEAGAAYHVEQGNWDIIPEYGSLAVIPLSRLLKNRLASKRTRTVEELSKIQDDRVEGLIMPMLDDRANEVRLKAVEVLEKSGSPAAKKAAAKTKKELKPYLEELADIKKKEQLKEQREKLELQKWLIPRCVSRVNLNEKKVTLDPGDGKLSLIDLFLKNEPAMIYELRDVENRLNKFPWFTGEGDCYPVAVVFGDKNVNARSYFRMSGTFTYKGTRGTIDDRQRIYYVSINKKGILSLHGNIVGEESSEWRSASNSEYYSESRKIINTRREMVYDPASYGLTRENFEEVMKDRIYTIRLLDIDMETIFTQFARHGTTFYSRHTRDVWRGDSNTYRHFHKPK